MKKKFVWKILIIIFCNKFIKYKEEELKKLQINLESKLLKSFIIYVKKINSK